VRAFGTEPRFLPESGANAAVAAGRKINPVIVTISVDIGEVKAAGTLGIIAVEDGLAHGFTTLESKDFQTFLDVDE
jgi:hypothetical protein